MDILKNERNLAENDRIHVMEAYNLQAGIMERGKKHILRRGNILRLF